MLLYDDCHAIESPGAGRMCSRSGEPARQPHEVREVHIVGIGELHEGIQRCLNSNFSAWLQFCQWCSRPRELHNKPSKNLACGRFTRAWVLDPAETRRQAPWHLQAAAVPMRARSRDTMPARQRRVTPALTSCDIARSKKD